LPDATGRKETRAPDPRAKTLSICKDIRRENPSARYEAPSRAINARSSVMRQC